MLPMIPSRPVDRDRTLRAIAARLERAAARARERGEAEAALDMQEAVVDLLVVGSPEEARLLSREPERIVRTMNVDTSRHGSDVKRGATRARRKHPAQRKLYEQGMTIASVAKELGETRSRVSSWMADGEGLRPIPSHIAEKLRTKYGIPLSVWRRVAE
jgi:hypothetical protein